MGLTVTIHGDGSHIHKQQGRAWDEVDLFSWDAIDINESSAANSPGRRRVNACFLNSEGSGQDFTTVRVRTFSQITGDKVFQPPWHLNSCHFADTMCPQECCDGVTRLIFDSGIPLYVRKGAQIRLERLLWKTERHPKVWPLHIVLNTYILPYSGPVPVRSKTLERESWTTVMVATAQSKRVAVQLGGYLLRGHVLKALSLFHSNIWRWSKH